MRAQIAGDGPAGSDDGRSARRAARSGAGGTMAVAWRGATARPLGRPEAPQHRRGRLGGFVARALSRDRLGVIDSGRDLQRVILVRTGLRRSDRRKRHERDDRRHDCNPASETPTAAHHCPCGAALSVPSWLSQSRHAWARWAAASRHCCASNNRC